MKTVFFRVAWRVCFEKRSLAGILADEGISEAQWTSFRGRWRRELGIERKKAVIRRYTLAEKKELCEKVTELARQVGQPTACRRIGLPLSSYHAFRKQLSENA